MYFSRLALAVIIVCLSTSANAQKIQLIDPLKIIEQANALYDSAKYGESIERFNAIPVRDTAYTDILADLAYSYIDNKEFDKAISICQERLSKPTEDRATFLKIQALAVNKKGDYQRSSALFEEAIRQYPSETTLLYNMGIAQYNNGEYQKAENTFFRILYINPFHAGSHLYLGRLAIRQGHKVHGMLAMGIYLGVNPNDNPRLSLINNFVDNQVDDEGSIPSFSINAASKLDQLVRARIVNEDGFKSIFNVKAPVVQQYELLYSQLGSMSSPGNDPYLAYYHPVYKAIKEANGLEAFVHHLLTSSNIKESVNWRNKNEKEMNVFFTTTNTALKKHRENLAVPELGFTQPVNAWYNANNQLTALGNYANEKNVGRWIFLHANAEKRAEGVYGNGVKTGTWKYYHPNGTLKSTENYETGEVTVYSDKGDKAEHFFLKNDEIEGDVELYYSSGPLKEKLKFKAGQRDGQRDVYFPDGTLSARYQYTAGKLNGPFIKHYEDGTLGERGTYKNDWLHGKYEVIFPNGKPSITGEYLEGYQTGVWKYYFSNGRIQRTGSYVGKGLPKGEWLYYNARGELVEKRNFDDEGRYHGDDTYYEGGKIISTLTYKKDLLVNAISYDEAGKVISSAGSNDGSFYSKNYYSSGVLRSEGKYTKGKADGKWKFYNRYGRLTNEYNYKSDQLDGPAIDYFPSGEKKIECEYKEGQLHGYFTEYHRNGKIKQQGWYQDGKREQQWLTYYLDGTLESDFYYISNVNRGVGKTYAVDGKLYSEVNVDDENNITDLRYFKSGGDFITVKRKEKFTDVYEDFYSNKKIRTRNDVLCGMYTRVWERYFPDGSLSYKYTIRNGEKWGEYIGYEVNGKVSGSGMYWNDMQTGLWKDYHDNGNLYSEGNYLEDERDSLWTHYYDNGKVSSKGWFLEGKRDGVTVYYAPDGAPLLEKLFRQGDIVAYRAVKEPAAEWIKFTGDGSIKVRYANGNIAMEEEYRNGLQQSFDRIYYPDGKLFSEYQYENGELTGDFQTYHPNGKLKAKGSFKNDAREGKFESFSPDGTIESSENYRQSYRHGKTILYSGGAKKKEFNFWFGGIEE